MRIVKRLTPRAAGAVLVAALLVAPTWAQTDYSKFRGYVDKEPFSELVDEDGTHIEVWVPSQLLKLAGAFDEELKGLVDGLELVQAIVMETDDEGAAKRLTERLRATESTLMKRGWIRLAKVKDGSEQVSVLILSDDETIEGLTVMISDPGPGGSFVFANVVGVIDLAEIQRLGEHMNIPGLDDIKMERP